jgi:Protein of unknown function (DUF3435).
MRECIRLVPSSFADASFRNTYILPEIIFDPSLVLSPHVFLLGLLFADRAFDRVDGEDVLVSASQLPQLRIRDECNELRLLIDPAMDDVPVFRMSERTLDGIGISPIMPLPYSTLEPWVKKIGVITGIRQVTRPYSLRYGAGAALDSSGESPRSDYELNGLTQFQAPSAIPSAILLCITPTRGHF